MVKVDLITGFLGSGKTTFIKQALKYAPIKTEFQRALSTDETIKSRLSSDMATEVENEMVYENSEMELNK